ncbi:mersacidin/lichenicidin family type 2 lantibiotic [[Pseudopropionibacterium] massiliense]|uniref:mersacidin/lichenicidin family type 2 lantibiotic n=1 Tax=[Pseudopropionibacterium] massiliense TaxID=2220000 RepID=UPI001031C298|nr:mersacidin/lichenicidin family type 2 lantibiotic [[Pseudopropionibacterium] massiliense]
MNSSDSAILLHNPAGIVELDTDDMDLDMTHGGTTWWCAIATATIALTATKCSPDGTLCGSCQMGTRGCC